MITREELPHLREVFGLSQTSMANLIGFSLRSYQDVENGRVEFRKIHQLAIERALMGIAAGKQHIEALPEDLRKDAWVVALEP